MEGMKKSVLAQQQTAIRSLTLYFSDQLSNIQAHYLATVLVSTLSEAILFMIACGIYFAMRALPMYIYSDYESMARHHARKTMAFEAEWGLLVEKSWQGEIIHNIDAMDFLSIFYKYGLWIVIATFHLWILWFQSTHYSYLRNGFWLTTFIAGIMFIVRPEAPPRLMKATGVIDSIVKISGFENTTIGPYDSFPSLHFAWSIIVCFGTLMYVQTVRSSTIMALLGLGGVVYPVLTFYALVVTGNHWVSDALAGAVTVVLGFSLSRLPPFRDFCVYHRYHMMAYYQEINVRPYEEEFTDF